MAEPQLRISAPRQLRLSALLDALLDDARRRSQPDPPEPPHTEDALPAPAAAIAPGDPIVLDSRAGLTIGEMLDATAAAGFGFVIALLGLTAIPFVGLSTPFGLAIAFIGAQMTIGRARPWLPQRVRRVHLTVPAIDKIGRWLARLTHWMTHLVRARWTRLCRGGGLTVVGLGVLVQGLGLALPLPIPGSNLVFLVPILVYAIGLLEEDGALVLVGHLATALHIALGFAAWRVVAAALRPVAAWLGF